ncbi:MAG: hypothetical protein EOS28_18375 [Mesorhizobium sp.]|nr:MAG: hypothetical protein EOS28_18375 [Mesorhizobium sp.]RWF01133.1 MAG: hypothetical protein EOS68_08380 [Mesorhizobium sp.]
MTGNPTAAGDGRPSVEERVPVSLKMTINFDQLREIGNLGVRRAAVFMGIGTNAAQLDPPVSHVLDGGMQFKVVPDDLPIGPRKAYAEEFARWVVANGFRELAETFSVFLHEVYSAALVLDREKMNVVEHRKAVAKFSRQGVSEQLTIASTMLEIAAPFAATFETMNQARNCMAHRRGVVGVEDTDSEGSFTLKWRAFALTLGDGRDLTSLLAAGQTVDVQGGQTISLGMVDREKSFSFGEQISLTQHELQEFCIAVTVAAECVTAGLAKLAEKKGKMPAKDKNETTYGHVRTPNAVTENTE